MICELDFLSQDEFEKKNRVDEFCNYAYHLHDDVVNQKYGEGDSLPYSFHLKSVVNCVREGILYIIDSADDYVPVIFAAAFHDSIEDARLTYNDVLKIAKKYMTDDQALQAAEIVYALTNEKGRNRQERANDKYYEGIRQTKYAPFVKLCDRKANYMYSSSTGSSMKKKYDEEMDHFIEAINSSENPDKAYHIPTERTLRHITFRQNL